MSSARSSTSLSPIAMVGYPEKFELALRYGEGPLQQDPALNDSDKLLLYAVSKQAQHGPCKEPRPSMWDAVAKAKWNAWKELGNRSAFEAMFMYVSAVETFNPDWWQWPPLGLHEDADDEQEEEPSSTDAEESSVKTEISAPVAPPAPALAPAVAPAAAAAVKLPLPPLAVSGQGTEATSSAATAPADGAPSAVAPSASASSAAATSAAAPMQLAPNALAVGGWSSLADEGAPARYRHACTVVGARLFVFGGRSNSGRLAPDLYQLDLLSGRWSVPVISGESPDLRWGWAADLPSTACFAASSTACIDEQPRCLPPASNCLRRPPPASACSLTPCTPPTSGSNALG